MPKLNVNVDNGLEDLKLENHEKIESKRKKKIENKQKTKESKKDKNNYIKEIRNEMKLVIWPSKKDVIKYSVATILMILFLALFFIGLTALFDLLYAIVQGWIG